MFSTAEDSRLGSELLTDDQKKTDSSHFPQEKNATTFQKLVATKNSVWSGHVVQMLFIDLCTAHFLIKRIANSPLSFIVKPIDHSNQLCEIKQKQNTKSLAYVLYSVWSSSVILTVKIQ